MKYHKSAHSKPAVLGRQVKRKKHRLPSLQAHSQKESHTAEAGIARYNRRSPARPARHVKGERAGEDISARSDINSLHLQSLPVTTQQRAAQSSHNHAVAGLSPGMSSIRAARVVGGYGALEVDHLFSVMSASPPETPATSIQRTLHQRLRSTTSSPVTPFGRFVPRSSPKRKRSMSVSSFGEEGDVQCTQDTSSYASTPTTAGLCASLEFATPPLLLRQDSQTPPSSPSTIASLSPTTPHSSFRQFPFPRFGQSSPSKQADLPHIPSMTYDLMSQMAKDDLFYDNAEAIRIQTELFAKATRDSDLSPCLHLLSSASVSGAVGGHHDRSEELLSPFTAQSLRRRRLSRSCSAFSSRRHEPYSDTEGDLSDVDFVKASPTLDTIVPQRLFQREILLRRPPPLVDVKPISRHLRTPQYPNAPAVPPPGEHPALSDYARDRDHRVLQEDDNKDIEENVPPIESRIPHGRAGCLPLGLPISISGGFASAAKAIIAATKQCSMTAASIMLNCPKKRVHELKRHAIKARVREKQFAAKIAASVPQIQKSLVAHAVYTTNLASHEPRERQASARSLLRELKQAKRLGIPTLVFHLGSNKKQTADVVRRQVAGSIRKILSKVEGVALAIETMTHRCEGETSHSIQDLAELVHLVDMPGRIKVCIDLCHTLQQYDITTGAGRDDFGAAVERLGSGNIAALHVSDSYYPHGVDKDRHANLCFGVISLDAFRAVLRIPAFANTPIILETPPYFPALRQSTYSGLLSKALRLESTRAQEELDFFSCVLALTDQEWLERGTALIAEWKWRKNEIEDKIRAVVHQIGGATSKRWAEQRERINSDIQRARWFRGEAMLPVNPDRVSQAPGGEVDLALKAFLLRRVDDGLDLEYMKEEKEEEGEQKEEKVECCC